jgi:hypothetical protein
MARLDVMRRSLTSATLLLIGLAGLPAWGQATTYRWVDEHGRVHYGDVMPGQQAGRGHSELDRQGRVLRETERARLTPADRQAREEAQTRQEEARRRAEQQQRHDRALLTTYVSEQEIDLVRDRAMELEALRLRGLKARLASAAEKLAYSDAQIAPYERAGNPAPAAFTQMREEARAELARTGELIRQREQAMEQVRQRFDADKARFRELKAQMR